MAVTIGVYVLQMLSEMALGGDYLQAFGMKVNELIIAGQIWRLFTPMFLHASLLHIGFNMYALYVLGTGLERFYGRGRYLALYLLAGFSGNVASFIFSQSPSLGASTAVFGLLGAEGVFFYQNREIFGSMARRSLTNVVTIAAINLLIGLSPGIDNWGHMGGLVGGSLFAWFAGPRYQRQDPYLSPGVVDTRDMGDAFLAGSLVVILFALLAGSKIFLNLW
jgi:rhomboid protease GluP